MTAQALTVAALVLASLPATNRWQDRTSSGPTPQDCATAGVISPERIKLYPAVPSSAPALERILNDQSARGYRLVAWFGMLLFEKLPESANAPEYVVLRRRPRTFLRDLNQQGSLGFRLLRGTESYDPGTIMHRERAARSSGSDPGPTLRYEYQVVDQGPEEIEPFERSINEAAAKGYRPIGIERSFNYDSGGGIDSTSLSALLERIVGDSNGKDDRPGPADRFRLLEIHEKDVQRILNTYAGLGYELILVEGTTHPLFLLEKSPDSRKREYFVVRPTVASNMGAQVRRDLNQAAARGFRLLPGAVFECSTKRKWGFLFGRGLAVVMELREKPEPEPEYFAIIAMRTSTFRRELDSALAQGFAPVGTGSAIILQRPRIPCAAPAR